MSAASFGLLFLGALIGFVSAWGAASLGAKARIIEHDERHQDELDRIASVQLQREEAIRRGHPVEYPDEPLNRWQMIREKHVETHGRVLPFKASAR